MRAYVSGLPAVVTYGRRGRIIVVLEGHRTAVPAATDGPEAHALAALRVMAERWGTDGHLVGGPIAGGFAWALCEGPEPDPHGVASAL